MKLSTPLILFLSFVIQNFVLIKFNHGGFLKRETDFSFSDFQLSERIFFV